MPIHKDSAISRREFARRAALVSAAASLSPTELLKAESTPGPVSSPQAPDTPKLSPESQVEADSRIQSILAQYGSRLSDAQKADLTRLSNAAQPMLDHLRAYPVDNGDGPGLYLKPLMEREKKAAPAPGAAKPPAAAKKP